MNKFLLFLFLFSVCLSSCNQINPVEENSIIEKPQVHKTSLIVLGTIQDAGSPQIACKKECCKKLFSQPDKDRMVVSLGLYDAKNNKRYLFEASPDIARQMKWLKEFGELTKKETADGIFLTHAHIGHYAGLMYLGKEAMDAKNVRVFTMPRMKKFLQSNGPWSQLVIRNNIKIQEIENESQVILSEEIRVIPFLVPHRDEFSETVGYRIEGPNKSALFIPDIDKWEKWEKDIIEEIKAVDYAFLDATFFNEKEINNRDISQIPHPFIIESLEKFKDLTASEKQKIFFIHFNHTNPVISLKSMEAKTVIEKGFHVAKINQVIEL